MLGYDVVAVSVQVFIFNYFNFKVKITVKTFVFWVQSLVAFLIKQQAIIGIDQSWILNLFLDLLGYVALTITGTTSLFG